MSYIKELLYISVIFVIVTYITTISTWHLKFTYPFFYVCEL